MHYLSELDDTPYFNKNLQTTKVHTSLHLLRFHRPTLMLCIT